MRVVVTGAASGIGKATARRFLAEGHEVLAVDLDEAGLQDLSAEGASTMIADVADPDQRAAVATEAAGCSSFVYSAAAIFTKDLLTVTVEDWRRLFAINAESVFFVCQQVGPTMPSGSAIIILSSSSAKQYHRGRGLRGDEDHHLVDHTIVRLPTGLAGREGQRDLPGRHRYSDAGSSARGGRAGTRVNRR